MSDITIHEYAEKDLSNALVIASFPTTGLISSIVASFIVNNLKLKRIAAFISDEFFPGAIIQNGIPTPPITVYSGDHVCGPQGVCEQLVVISSDLPVNPATFGKLSDAILAWCAAKKCKLIATIEGINRTSPLGEEDEVTVYSTSSTEKAAQCLEGHNTELFETGIVSGMSGLLLYKANILDIDVITLLAEAHKEFPDSRSAAAALKVLDDMVPQIKMDPAPLIEEAEAIEKQIKTAMSQMPTPDDKPMIQNVPPGMYG